MVYIPIVTPLVTGLLSDFISQPYPLPCSGICNNTHDPSIALGPDGTYYRFATGNKISIFEAPTLTGPWTYNGAGLPGCSSIQLDGNCDLWAPSVHNVDGEYYMYYSVSTFGSQNSAVGVATSKTLDSSSWTDHGSTGVSSASGDYWNAIDGALVYDASANQYSLSFGSFWADIFVTPMQDPPIRSAGDPYINISLNRTAPQAEEGSYIYPSNGYYYLFFSSGICCGFDVNRPPPGEEYKIMVCRSESVDGPYIDANGVDCMQSGGTKVLGSHGWVYGPGGQGVFDDPILGPVLYYHYVDTRIGYGDGQKVLGINPVDFSSGWPILS